MRRLLALAVLVAGCSDPPQGPPAAILCVESPELAGPTERAAARWESATGVTVLVSCDRATAWIYFDDSVPSAADLYREREIRIRPELDGATVATAAAHELGHLLQGGDNQHTQSGLMSSHGDDGKIDEASLRFVCSGALECADFRPET